MKTVLLVGLTLALMFAVAAGNLHGAMLFDGDGSDEPGFVAPLPGPPPPPPPANVSSAETIIPYPGPPAVPQARSEKKRPPTPPVMFIKIKSDKGMLDWNSRPNDLNNLLKSMKEMINVDFSMEARYFSEIDTDPERNPILYRSGHFHFQLTPAEREKLRQYLLNGGMIIFNTGMGSKPFYESARAELQAMFPEVPLVRLSSDHPIFHSYYDLNHVDYRKGVRQAGYTGSEPWLEGITIDCRTVAVISRWGMGIGWDALDDDSLQGYSIDSARKLGINLMSYAMAERAWAKNVTSSMQFVDKDTGSASKLFIAQVIYDGEWKTRHAGLSVLLQQFNQKTSIPVKYAVKDLRLSDPKIFDAPMLYMTGHEGFHLSEKEVDGLREYLRKGGLLFGEACCGRRAFAESFVRELRRVLPGQTLKQIPNNAPLFLLPNAISRVGVTPAMAALLGNQSMMAPELDGIQIDNHYAVIFSPYGMQGGWELSQNPYARGYDNAGSLALGEDILMYAITQ